MRRASRLLVALSLVAAAAVPAGAYTLLGIRAQFHTLTYYVNPNFNNIKDVNAGTVPQQVTAMTNGGADWTGFADFQFTYGGQTTVSTVNADGVNAMFYQDNTGDPLYGALAICWTWTDAYGFVTDFDVEFYDFSGTVPGYDYFYFGLPAPNFPGPAEFDIWSIATHELGHAAGLGHTNLTDNTVTMFATTSPADITHRVLHSDDIAGLQAIYGSGPYSPKSAGAGVTCPANQNVTVGAATAVSGWQITNTGGVADYFNYTLTDAGAGILAGNPVTGQTPLLNPGQSFPLPAQQIQFGCGATAAVPVFFQAVSAGSPATTGSCSTTFTPTGGAFIAQSLIGGTPSGVAFDASDNLYVADIANGRVLFWAAGAYGTTGTPLILGLPTPRGIAIGPNGNLFVVQGDGAISEWMIPSGAPAGLPVGPGWLTNPMDLAFCGSDLYVTDPGSGTVWCIPAAGGGIPGTPLALATGFADLFGIAVDPGGNLFVTGGSTGNIHMFAAAGGPPVVVGNVGAGGFAMGIAVDTAFNLFVAEGFLGGDIDVFPLGSPNPTATFPGATSGWTWMAFSRNRQAHGPGMLDTYLHTSNTANLGPANCSAQAIVRVDVGPQGFANGEVIPSAAACAAPWAGTVYVGSPPLSGMQPSGLAFDIATGMLYSVDRAAGTLDVTMPGATGTSQLTSGLQAPQGMAVGPDGFLYICESGGRGTVSVYDFGGGHLHDLYPPGSFVDPHDLAWCGNSLFIADRGTGILHVEAFALGGPRTAPPLPYQSGFADLFGVAVDAAGSVFVTTGANATLERVHIGPEAGTTVLATLTGAAEGIAMDQNGDMWVADGVSGDLVQFQNGTGAVLATVSNMVDGPCWLAWGLGTVLPGQADSRVFWSNLGGENPTPPPAASTVAWYHTGTPGLPVPQTPVTCASTSAVEDLFAGRPLVTQMLPAFPNPFRSTTRLAFYLESEGEVILEIHDVAGRRVRSLLRERRPAGPQEITWDGSTDAGAAAGPGIYFVRFRAEGAREVGKILLRR